MKAASRTGLHLRMATVVVMAALVTGGCGGGGSSSPAAGPGTQPPSSSPTVAVSTKSTGAPRTDGTLVRIEKYGISYRVPKGWLSINGKSLLKPDNPVLRQIAQRSGISVDQVISSISANMQAYAITDQGAVDGILDNVNDIGFPVGGLTDAQMKAQIAGTGATPGTLAHAHSPAGDLTRISYVWTTSGRTFYGVALAIDLGDATTSITVTSHAPDRARAIADLVQGSLQKIG
jgi:hypothetical protein